MLITLDKERCRKCGVCSSRMKGYCISEENGYPVFDKKLCNTCQKCAAICPFQAIMVNGRHPEKLESDIDIEPEKIYSLLERRRSIKRFSNKEIPEEVMGKILSAASFAPNQNKNISLHVITDKHLIDMIDRAVMRFVKRFYKLLFGFKPVELFISIFYKDIRVIKAKMELTLFNYGIYPDTQAVIVAVGKKKVPVTESSAHYVLAALMFMAEALGVGSCLMDSISLALRTDKKTCGQLKIKEDVLGVLALGYSAEKIINVPKGYKVNAFYNV